MKNKVYLSNLLIFVVLWIVGTFNYYLIYFQIKYMKGDVFINTIASSGSEMASYVLSGLILDKIGLKLSYLSSYVIVIIGTIFYVILIENHEDLIPVMLLVTSFGISSCLNINWNGNAQLFPVIFASSTNGICNIFARLSNILAP